MRESLLRFVFWAASGDGTVLCQDCDKGYMNQSILKFIELYDKKVNFTLYKFK